MSDPIKFVKRAWISEIYRNTNVDPHGECCWESLALGFALGRGLDVADAEKLVAELYKEELL